VYFTASIVRVHRHQTASCRIPDFTFRNLMNDNHECDLVRSLGTDRLTEGTDYPRSHVLDTLVPSSCFVLRDT
jgi:hypothetical protein